MGISDPPGQSGSEFVPSWLPAGHNSMSEKMSISELTASDLGSLDGSEHIAEVILTETPGADPMAPVATISINPTLVFQEDQTTTVTPLTAPFDTSVPEVIESESESQLICETGTGNVTGSEVFKASSVVMPDGTVTLSLTPDAGLSASASSNVVILNQGFQPQLQDQQPQTISWSNASNQRTSSGPTTYSRATNSWTTQPQTGKASCYC